jgi:hypothetical protein
VNLTSFIIEETPSLYDSLVSLTQVYELYNEYNIYEFHLKPLNNSLWDLALRYKAEGPLAEYIRTRKIVSDAIFQNHGVEEAKLIDMASADDIIPILDTYIIKYEKDANFVIYFQLLKNYVIANADALNVTLKP